MLDDDSVDFFQDTATTIDPYPYLDALVAERPVWREPHHGVVMVTGYEEALSVYRNPDTFSSCNVVAGPNPAFSVEFTGDDISEQIEQHRHELPQSDQIPSFDPPRHTATRALLMGLITPKRLKENEAFMWRLADRQLDEVLAKDTVEFIDEYAQPYTRLVIADLLGVPESDHTMLLGRRVDDGQIIAGTDPESQAAGHNSLDVFYDYFVERIEDRRREPREDVLTGMAQATYPDDSVPDPIDVARVAANLFAAGQETTVRLLGTLLRRIADDPALQGRLRADREAIPKFIEESLRTEGPIKGEFRLARRTTTLGGVEIPAGTTLLLSNGAASRDPRQFDDPARFRVDRPNVRRHLAFGHGIHTCPGAPLARSEVRVTIERLLDRTTDIRVVESVHGPSGNRRWDVLPSYMLRGLEQLHLELVPATRQNEGESR